MKREFTLGKIVIKNSMTLWLILLLTNLSLIVLYAAIWPSMQAQTDSFNALLAGMPPAFLKAFNIAGTMDSGFETLLLTKQLSIILPVLSLILANGIAGNALGGEVDKDTILLHLSAPLSRLKIYWSKYIAGAILVVLFSASVLGAIPFAMLFGITVVSSHFAIFTFETILFSMALYSLAFWISAGASSSGKVSAVTVSIFLSAYVLNLVAQLTDSLVNLKYVSLLHYFGPSTELVAYSLPIFLAVIAMSAVAGSIVFVKRDIQIR